MTNFFSVRGRTDPVSDAQHSCNRDIAAFAAPKGTLDCIGAFSGTGSRKDLAKCTMPTLTCGKRRTAGGWRSTATR